MINLPPIQYKNSVIKFIKMTENNYLRLNEITLESGQEKFIKIIPDKIFKNQKGYLNYLLSYNDKIIGYRTLFLNNKNNELRFIAMAITKDHQNNGIGTKVLTSILNNIKVEKYMILTHPNNINGQKLIKKHGFQQITKWIYMKYE